MSKSSEIKGKRSSKKNNFSSAKKYRKHIPYGSTRQKAYDNEDELNLVVNKAKERRKNKIDIKTINLEDEDN